MATSKSSSKFSIREFDKQPENISVASTLRQRPSHSSLMLCIRSWVWLLHPSWDLPGATTDFGQMFEQGLMLLVPSLVWVPGCYVNINTIGEELWRTVIRGGLMSMNQELDHDWYLYANRKCGLHTFPCVSSFLPTRMASVCQPGSNYFICWCSCSCMNCTRSPMAGG